MQELTGYLSAYFDTDPTLSSELAKRFREEHLNRGEFHTKLGSRNGKLSFVKEGYLRIYKQTDKKEVTQWISSPGEFTTELNSIMFDQPARWNIQAITDCILYTLDVSEYRRIQDEVDNWQKIEKLFLGKCFITVEDRVFSFLSMTAEERYDFLYSLRKDLFQQVPQQYLASMLGMTPETFSRIRAKSIS